MPFPPLTHADTPVYDELLRLFDYDKLTELALQLPFSANAAERVHPRLAAHYSLRDYPQAYFRAWAGQKVECAKFVDASASAAVIEAARQAKREKLAAYVAHAAHYAASRILTEIEKRQQATKERLEAFNSLVKDLAAAEATATLAAITDYTRKTPEPVTEEQPTAVQPEAT